MFYLSARTANRKAQTMPANPVGEAIAHTMSRTADREAWDRRWSLKDRLAAFTVPQLVDFLAAEGVRFTGRPKRDAVVAEILDTFTPEDAEGN